MMAREVGLPIVRAIEAFGREQYAEATELLMPVRYRAHLFGGSHAQRDVVHRTLLEAALRAGRQTAGAGAGQRARVAQAALPLQQGTALASYAVVSFKPAIPPTIIATNNRRSAVAGSPNSTMPRITVPVAPIPVHTA